MTSPLWIHIKPGVKLPLPPSPSLCLTAFAIAASSSCGQASVLNFDDLVLGNYGAIPDTYGDNLPGTPDITIDYRTVNPGDNSTVAPNLLLWNSGYGDLVSVPFPTANGDLAEISLVPATGFYVTLLSFDYAGYGSGTSGQTLRITDASYNVLVDYSPATFPPNPIGHFSAFPGQVSSGTLRIQFGPDWNSAIDNIVFGQVPIPEPSSVVGITTFGLLAWAGLRKRQDARRANKLTV